MPRLLVAAISTALFLTACRPSEPEPPPAAVVAAPAGTAFAAVSGALSVADPLARAATLAAVLQGLGPDAVEEVADAYEGLDRSSYGTLGVELALIIEWWGRKDPAGAYRWLRAKRFERNLPLMRALVRSWATRDPAAAREVVQAAVGRDRGYLLAALAEGWLASGRDGVVEFLIELPPGEERQRAIAFLARRMVLSDGIEATFRWAEALPDDTPNRFKLQAHRRVATAVAEVDPERAAAWVERQLDGDYWDGLPRRVAVRWAERDGEATMTWLAGLPPEKLGISVDEAFMTWHRRDPEAAAAWLEREEGPPALEPAVSFYARIQARGDPATALAWATKISNPGIRRETLSKIGRIWMARDPEAARAWLAESELSPEERERLLNPPQSRRRGPSPPRKRRGEGPGPGSEAGAS